MKCCGFNCFGKKNNVVVIDPEYKRKWAACERDMNNTKAFESDQAARLEDAEPIKEVMLDNTVRVCVASKMEISVSHFGNSLADYTKNIAISSPTIDSISYKPLTLLDVLMESNRR